MSTKKTIVLKLTGSVLLHEKTKTLDSTLVTSIAQQIKALHASHYFGIVIGGGSFFRKNDQGKQLGLTAPIADQIGMLATVMNGMIIKDLFEQQGVNAALFCAATMPDIGIPICPQTIRNAREQEQCAIFSGGTGNPFFTTDTNAILRALQLGATQVWKATNVDGVYSGNPKTDPNATLLRNLSYKEALGQKLAIMDATAFALAQEHHLKIRVFNIFKENALINVAQNDSIGSSIEN